MDKETRYYFKKIFEMLGRILKRLDKHEKN